MQQQGTAAARQSIASRNDCLLRTEVVRKSCDWKGKDCQDNSGKGKARTKIRPHVFNVALLQIRHSAL
jgi:hypothetical protein